MVSHCFPKSNMSPSISAAKFLSALISRRGYAAASQGALTARSGVAAPPKMSKTAKDQAADNAWVPDPVTGYYSPADRPNQIDVADLRHLLLKHEHQ